MNATIVTAKPVEVVKKMFLAAEMNDDNYFTFFHDEAPYQVGNLPPAIGPEAIRKFVAPIQSAASAVVHEILSMWELGDTVICEVLVFYTRRSDGASIGPLPGCNIIKVEGDKIKSLHAYVDIAPLFA